mgnify:FL=1
MKKDKADFYPRKDVLAFLHAGKPEQIAELLTGGRKYSAEEIADEIEKGTDFGKAVYFKLESTYDMMTRGGRISNGRFISFL